jgi:hypothetical protein
VDREAAIPLKDHFGVRRGLVQHTAALGRGELFVVVLAGGGGGGRQSDAKGSGQGDDVEHCFHTFRSSAIGASFEL